MKDYIEVENKRILTLSIRSIFFCIMTSISIYEFILRKWLLSTKAIKGLVEHSFFTNGIVEIIVILLIILIVLYQVKAYILRNQY